MAKVYISIGSNIDRDQQIINGVAALKATFGKVQLSSVYECEPVGFIGENFYNLVAMVETEQPPSYIGEILKQLEKQQGRIDFSKKFSPRQLDLDILLYDDLIINTPVQLPRNEIPKNAYVLQPLAEIAGDLIHPQLQQSYRQLWQNYDKNKQQLKKIAFSWPK
ncbi:2-amino-4-hydroxy-6-hydroxymethyldihydropteridine diphosphokinase [Thalassotalea sp. ND16A]|uniref:2-amino-4-hydroxy-6- hydroxymethyldihydropteridine diphosphokinase n=1 Tax=Thalassotalea sp. ND16A TaxID=1535422 RepID=UPI00051A1AD3|nr:2-amino-4-hydroxy-6-hydroxymethyldihydropteridine diphosphokinase [Thalassotalea sp. ND16A]KGJ89279.1 hypothetical protein ND16A_2172 [Thalassotalea sp. ND16A]